MKIFPHIQALTEAVLQDNQVVETKGYYSAGDGAGAKYFISSTGPVDGYINHTTANGKYAYLQDIDSLNVKLAGAVGDGVTDDTAAIQAAIDSASDGSKVYFPAGTYITSDKITVSKRLNLVGDGPRMSNIQCNSTSGTGAIEFNTTWNQSIEGMGILGSALNGSGLILNSSNFQATYCRFENHQGHGIYITPQNWTISIDRCFSRNNGIDGLNAVATGSSGQINAVFVTKTSLTLNGRHGAFINGSAVSIDNSNIEGNASNGIRISTQNYSCYTVNITNNYIESNPDGHIYCECYPSLGYNLFKLNISGNYMYMNASGATSSSVAFIGATTDTTYSGISSINIDRTNYFLTDTLKHVSLGNAVSLQGQSTIETSNCGDTPDYSTFYENIGSGGINTYQKKRTISGYFHGKGTITHSSLERSANINASILGGPMTGLYPLDLKVGNQVKKVDVRVATDNTNYSIIFNVYKRNSKSIAAFALATTQTLSGLSGNGTRSTSDFSTLTDPANVRLADNEEYYLELIIQSAGGGGTYFYLYNPIITFYE